MNQSPNTEDRMNEARRNFLASCGKFAVATPPALTLLLAASNQDYATAASGGGFPLRGGRQGNNGFGNGGGDGVPGNSNFRDIRR